MGVTTRSIKVSDMAERSIAYKLGVERVRFGRLKHVKPFVFRFTFFVYDFYGFVGTANLFWDLRKISQFIVLKNYETNKMIFIRHLNEPQVQGFFGVSI